MWSAKMLVFMLLVTSGVLLWCFVGYPLYLRLRSRRSPKKENGSAEKTARVSIIVPCLNERNTIVAKLRDLRALGYPKDRIEFVFVDGGSTDGTLALLHEERDRDSDFELLRSPHPGKVAQLRYAISRVKSDIIVNTDADAILAPDVVQRLVDALSDLDVGIAGTRCVVKDGSHPIERFQREKQNELRSLENAGGSASIVLGPCLAMRREMMQRLLAEAPDDVLAEDVYLAFQCHAQGLRVRQVDEAVAVEQRAPTNLGELWRQKRRRVHAFERETFRAIRSLRMMNRPVRLMLLTLIVQQTVAPWALIAWPLLVASIAMTVIGNAWLVAGAIAMLFVLFALFKNELLNAFRSVMTSVAVLCVTLVAYPFERLHSRPWRLNRSPATEKNVATRTRVPRRTIS